MERTKGRFSFSQRLVRYTNHSEEKSQKGGGGGGEVAYDGQKKEVK
jgi:hypothetical protein